MMLIVALLEEIGGFRGRGEVESKHYEYHVETIAAATTLDLVASKRSQIAPTCHAHMLLL